jgi:purine nucleosidase
MTYPSISEETRLRLLRPPEGRVTLVLDTDTYNEVDDQFAVAYALRSPEKIDLKAIYAAPFHNNRSDGPEDGMEKSYEEIGRLLERLDVPMDGFAFEGSRRYQPGPAEPVNSPAAEDLIAKALAMPDGEPLYVAAIGAITNVASAILLEPKIIERIVIVWLGGQPFHWHTASEFNLKQDLHAARVVFDSGVPLVHIPCSGVASHLLTTIPELEAYAAGRGAIGDYLVETVKGYHEDHFAWGKVIWDIAAIGWLLDESWVPSHLVHSPILTDAVTWSIDTRRHFIRTAVHVDRNKVFGDLFKKLG